MLYKFSSAAADQKLQLICIMSCWFFLQEETMACAMWQSFSDAHVEGSTSGMKK